MLRNNNTVPSLAGRNIAKIRKDAQLLSDIWTTEDAAKTPVLDDIRHNLRKV
jgi:hypothetical protein